MAETFTTTIAGVVHFAYERYCIMDTGPSEISVGIPRPDELTPGNKEEEAPRRLLCWGCDKPGMFQCARCKHGRYCSKECQRKDYPLHRRGCEPSNFTYPSLKRE